MKTIQKILAILLIAVCVVAVMPKNVVMASTAAEIVGNVQAQETADTKFAEDLQTTIGRLLGFLQVASGLAAIIMIAIVGFNCIVATPGVKDEMKQKMLPIIIGIVLVFGAVSIARFVLSVAA